MSSPPWIHYIDKDESYEIHHEATLKSKYKLVSLSMYGNASQPSYAAVWQLQTQKFSEQQFKSGFTSNVSQDLSIQGWMPTILAANGIRYRAVLERTSAPTTSITMLGLLAAPEPSDPNRLPAASSASETTFDGYNALRMQDNYLLRWMTSYLTADGLRYGGIWIPNSSKFQWGVWTRDKNSIFLGRREALRAGWVYPHVVVPELHVLKKSGGRHFDVKLKRWERDDEPVETQYRSASIWYDGSIGPWEAIPILDRSDTDAEIENRSGVMIPIRMGVALALTPFIGLSSARRAETVRHCATS